MFNDNTILTVGKYKFTRLCRVPPEYLLELYKFHKNDKTYKELIEYIDANMGERPLTIKGEGFG